MKQRIRNYMKVMVLAAGVLSLSLAVAPTSSATGVNVFTKACSGQSTDGVCGATSSGDFTTLMKNIVNILFVVLGIASVLMIIIGGIRYTTSNGDSGQVTSAKNTIMYAVVGLVVAIMAYAIVNFVLGSFKS